MFDINQVATVLLMIIAIAACSARFYIRAIKGRQHTWMEYMLVLAVIMHITNSSLQIRMYEILGSDNPAEWVELRKLFFSGTFFYYGSLWSVKISINLLHIQLTRKLPHVYMWAVRSLWVLIISWPFLYVTYLVGCLPITKYWAGPGEPSCPPVVEKWDFWAKIALHILTDVFLCILPFPALLKVSERRLRLAVCAVYSLAIVSIVVTICRTILLVTDVKRSTVKINLLSAVELTVCIVVGVFPGVSSAFTRKYILGASASGYGATNTSSSARKAKRDFSKDNNLTAIPPSTEFIELHPQSHTTKSFRNEREETESVSVCESTDRIIHPAKG